MLKIALSAALLAAVLPAPVLAQDNLPDVRVYYGDLDLADPAAVRTFDRRLANAVEAACPSDAGLREVTRLREIAACRTAKQASVATLRQSALAAANGEKNVLASAR
ncbi:UrcA family protein [Novosphingobium sp. JCM 18896]|uniref:UrcA family protein n=1 Tax=Novosphingobium sp. JCM 18896 TaxID=2989731 RepID=UPI002221B7B0|nr:UrcA family protein [Novosphingobium sp. JCM 18896]MCW1429665.1 UrcA family protein [Novosphingobium sp. JCM 18896]